jgi:CO/xanthine dehydrogenase FAD-binding subunit
MKASRPEAVPIAGGTDLMVAINFDAIRPPAMLDVSSLPELREMRRTNGSLFLGAGVTYARIVRELRGEASFGPLVQASRSVGSPQIRNRGTVGGNLGTASPAGDTLPVLACYEADVLLVGAGGAVRRIPLPQFVVDVKRTSASPQELIMGAEWRVHRGGGSFSKIGTRNAMVIAVANLCLVLDEDGRAVRVALGSVGPTVIRAREAETFAESALAGAGAWNDDAATVTDEVIDGFAERVAAAATPIDDVRGSAAYRRHGCRVLAGRALRWALADRRSQAAGETRGVDADNDGKGA